MIQLWRCDQWRNTVVIGEAVRVRTEYCQPVRVFYQFQCHTLIPYPATLVGEVVDSTSDQRRRILDLNLVQVKAMALTSDSLPRSTLTTSESIPHIFHIYLFVPPHQFAYKGVKPSSNAVNQTHTKASFLALLESSPPYHQVHSTTRTQHHSVMPMPSPSGQVSPTRRDITS